MLDVGFEMALWPLSSAREMSEMRVLIRWTVLIDGVLLDSDSMVQRAQAPSLVCLQFPLI